MTSDRSDPDRPDDDGATRPGETDGGRTTQASGTPMAVDLASDPATRRAMAMFVAAPTVWFVHFMFVYLVAEAGCTGSGTGLSLFDPPVPVVLTLAATVVAALGCLAVARWQYRQWRGGRRVDELEQPGPPPGGTDLDGDERPLAFVGVLLGLLSFVSVLFVGLPVLWFTGC